ncbi:MerC domain-containing protein [Sediminitomix flava]|uniref:MerC mercury resistance protein n=1 Tax=Sediminitomix flava TaxID=379075 RepID=A0A315Z6F5_SEDFL|nr:MerC domain-containing protein [Sediminitomix flava]PWJ39292.1 MerC mercury resistance protein [Sediminitomix flava]
MLKVFQKYADHLGITGSFICLIHCLVTAGISLMSVGMSHLHSHGDFDHLGFWGWVDLSTVFISILAVWASTRHNHNKSVQFSLWTFLAIFVTVVMLRLFHVHNPVLDILGYLGSLGLIFSHFFNIYICRKEEAAVCEVRG